MAWLVSDSSPQPAPRTNRVLKPMRSHRLCPDRLGTRPRASDRLEQPLYSTFLASWLVLGRCPTRNGILSWAKQSSPGRPQTVAARVRLVPWMGRFGQVATAACREREGAVVSNVDARTVAGFGDEWTTFDQSALSEAERLTLFGQYFAIFPWDALPPDATGFDLGCGSGRWAKAVAPRVKGLHCIDPSEAAIRVAERNLAEQRNCSFHVASVDEIPLDDASMDFGYSLGVLHHVPDTPAGIRSCVAKLKPGAPLLLYLYYAFDNRPVWFRSLWKGSDAMRRIVSALPYRLRHGISFAIASVVYWPLARGARHAERLGANVDALPLSYYRDRSFYVMRTDARDRFGTALEQRFTKDEIRRMMEEAGLERIRFSPDVPYWCAVGYKKT